MIRYFAYAGLDFLLTPEDEIYFLEANSFASGVYFINLMLEYLKIRNIDKSLYRLNIDFPKRYVEAMIKYSINWSGQFPSRVGIFFDKRAPQFLQDEYLYLKNLFISRGYDTILFTSDHILVKNDILYVKFGENILDVSLIINRALDLPKNIKQPVINLPIVDKIIRNKLHMEYVVYDYILKQKLPQDKYKLPKTVLIKNLDDLREKSKLDFFSKSGYVLKPVYGMWGLNIIMARDRKQLISKVSKMGLKWFRSNAPFILQEWIPVRPFRAGDGREYVYDIRVYHLIGEFAGGFCRRAPKPLDSKFSLESRFISNITRGGSIINLLVGCEEVSPYYLGEVYITSRDRIIFVDANGICLPEKIVNRLREYTKIVVRAVENEVRKILSGEPPEYPDSVIPS